MSSLEVGSYSSVLCGTFKSPRNTKSGVSQRGIFTGAYVIIGARDEIQITIFWEEFLSPFIIKYVRTYVRIW